MTYSWCIRCWICDPRSGLAAAGTIRRLRSRLRTPIPGTPKPHTRPISAKQSCVFVSLPRIVEFPTTTTADPPGLRTRYISEMTRVISE